MQKIDHPIFKRLFNINVNTEREGGRGREGGSKTETHMQSERETESVGERKEETKTPTDRKAERACVREEKRELLMQRDKKQAREGERS